MKLPHLVLALQWLRAVAALADVPVEDDEDIIPGAYIVEFDAPQNGDEFFEDLRREKVETESRAVFSSSVFQGASIRLGKTADGEATAERLARMPRVKKMWPVHMMRPPPHEVVWVANGSLSAAAAAHDALQRRRGAGGRNATAAAFSPHVMTQVDKLHAEGHTGRGLRVAVLDTGVDYTHPALGGCFGPGCVVAYGADLVGDAYDGSNTPVPDDDPFESCAGSYHGTHVAGTIAAQANNPFGFLGAAPDVTLGVYKVFGCTGGVAEDVLVAALLRAFDDGSDIITASIGSSSGWSERPSAVAAQRIVEAGVPVTMAAGNEGNRGMFYAASGATGRGVTSVAMVDNEVGVYQAKRASFLVADGADGDGTNATDFGWLNATPLFAENVTLPLYATSNTTDGLDGACQPLDDQTPHLADFIVLVRQDDARACTAAQQARHIADKGGRYLLWYSTGAEMANPYFDSEVPEVAGVAVVAKEQGASWTRLLSTGRKVVVEMTAAAQADLTFIEQANTVSGGLVNSRSTWGPSWELDLKPTFATVGGSVLSTYPVRLGGYGVLSGTSMSTPLAAAIYALVAQARDVRDPALLERLLTSTARPTAWGPDPAAGLASVAQQGAGLAQAYAAAHATTLLSVARLALNDSDHHVGEATFSITNTGAVDAVYALAHVPALSMDTFVPGTDQAAAFPNPIAAGQADVAFGAARVAVPAGGSVEVSVRITPPASLDPALLPVYSGWVTVTGSRPDDGALALPYLGVKGSMRDTALFDAAAFAMYNMTQWPETIPSDAGPIAFYLPYPTDFEAPMGVGVGWPYLQFRLRVGTRALYVDLMRASSSDSDGHDDEPKSVGSLRYYPGFFITRATSFFTFNGMLADGSVAPAGRYFVRVRAQKIFGDPASADGWETRDFPEFTIVYTTESPSSVQ